MNYNDDGTIKQITVKAGDTLPVGTEVDVPDGTTVPAGWVEVDKLINYTQLGIVNNSNTTINLSNDKLSNYTYLAVVSGYGNNVAITMIPVSLFKSSTTKNWCAQYVKTYDGWGLTSIKYVNDTSFIINGAVSYLTPSSATGTDTLTTVYGIK